MRRFLVCVDVVCEYTDFDGIYVLKRLSRLLGGRAPRSPDLAGVLERALRASSTGNEENAVALYTQALVDVTSADLYYKRANALNRLGRRSLAIADYSRSIELDPRFANAYCNRGTMFAATGDLPSALADYDRALSLNPGDSIAHYNRAHALKVSGQLDNALHGYEQAIVLKPDYVEAHVNRGNLLQEMQRHDAAIRSYTEAIKLQSQIAEAFLGRGLSHFKLGHIEAALKDMDEALAIRPDYFEAAIDRGHLLLDMGRPVEASESYSTALAQKPNQRYLIGLRRHALMQVCDWRGLEDDLQAIRQGLETGVQVCTPLPLLALLDSPLLHLRAARIWAADQCPPDNYLGESRPRAEDGKLRIGYFSADFRQHAVATLTAALFESHDRVAVQLTAFAFGPRTNDATRERLVRAFDRFIDVSALSDREVAAMARELGIDIAIDLGGYTEHCRTGVFACRAAPIQVGYLGYMSTMGAPYMDYLIADANLVPVVQRDCYAEKILYLPRYQANDPSRDASRTLFSRGALGLPESGFVFCCFNANYKILPRTFDSWMRILLRVPESSLYLYVSNTAAKANLAAAARERGVASDRLVFGARLSMPDYLARYRSMDLFLDTLPYNAGTTASDALWMGLPVLTLRGHGMAARMASSLLEALGLAELITDSEEAYEDKAVVLATQPGRVAALRQRLLDGGRRSSLFDARLMAQHVETALSKAQALHQAGKPPADIWIRDADG